MIEAGSVMAIDQKNELIIYQNDKGFYLPQLFDMLNSKIMEIILQWITTQ